MAEKKLASRDLELLVFLSTDPHDSSLPFGFGAASDRLRKAGWITKKSKYSYAITGEGRRVVRALIMALNLAHQHGAATLETL